MEKLIVFEKSVSFHYCHTQLLFLSGVSLRWNLGWSWKLKSKTENPPWTSVIPLLVFHFFYLNTTTGYKITLGKEEKKKYIHLDYLHNLHKDDKNTLGRQMVMGVSQQESWNTNPQGFPTFPCGNSSLAHKRTTNPMVEQKGFGLGIALAQLKPVPPVPVPLHSHPQHPFSFQSSPDDSSALISSSLFHLFFFFN